MIYGTTGAHKNNVRWTVLILDSRMTIPSSIAGPAPAVMAWPWCWFLCPHPARTFKGTTGVEERDLRLGLVIIDRPFSCGLGLGKVQQRFFKTSISVKKLHLRRLKMLFLLELLSAVLKPIRSLAFSSSTCCWRLLSVFPSVALPRDSEPEAGFNRSFSFIIYLFGTNV